MIKTHLFTVTLFVVVACVYSHLCVYSPRQRGDFFKGGAASHECFRPKVPCGGQAPGDIKATFYTNQDNQVMFQQNLNHYSIGSTGYLSVALSRNPDPQTQDDFKPLVYVTDYYPVRQWTQTNYTVTITLPDNEQPCDKCVLQVRYVPHKPTEPIFHQCSDIRIVASQAKINSEKVVTPSKPTLPNAKYDPNSLIGLYQQEDSLNLVQVTPETGALGVLNFWKFFKMSDNITATPGVSSGALRIQNGIATTDITSSKVYYLMNADTKFEHPDSYPDRLLIFDLQDLSYTIERIGNKFPLSNLFFVSSMKSIFAWSIDPAKGTWSLYRIDPHTGTIDSEPVVLKSDAGPYVNYLWSTYDSVNNRLITLVRHEDEPLNLDQKLFIVDFKNNYNLTEVYLNSTTYYAFSDIHFDSANNQQLLTLSPGHSPALPVTSTAQWSMIRINLEQKQSPSNHPFVPGEQDFEYSIPVELQQQLGGGVFRGLNQNDQVMYKVVRSKTGDYHVLTASTNSPNYSLSPPSNDLANVFNLIYVGK